MTKVTVTIERRGGKPPVYVAGSFTDPAWEPLMMDTMMAANGEQHFTKQVNVVEKADYHYKFLLADGTWVLDDTAPTGM